MPARTGVPIGYKRPAWERYPKDERPLELSLLAMRRLEGLMAWADTYPIPRLLESAYMQGIMDAIDALHQSATDA